MTRILYVRADLFSLTSFFRLSVPNIFVTRSFYLFVMAPEIIRHTQKFEVPSVESPELTNDVLHLKPGVGQNIAMKDSLTVRDFFHVFHVLISALPVH